MHEVSKCVSMLSIYTSTVSHCVSISKVLSVMKNMRKILCSINFRPKATQSKLCVSGPAVLQKLTR